MKDHVYYNNMVIYTSYITINNNCYYRENDIISLMNCVYLIKHNILYNIIISRYLHSKAILYNNYNTYVLIMHVNEFFFFLSLFFPLYIPIDWRAIAIDEDRAVFRNNRIYNVIKHLYSSKRCSVFLYYIHNTYRIM